MTAELTVERLAVERVAEDVAQLAVKDAALLTHCDPLNLVTPLLEDMEHPLLVRVAMLLLQRLCSTVRCQDPVFEPLCAAAEHRLLTALVKLEKCMGSHRAFQYAVSLKPLLNRVVTIASQCCCLALHGTPEVQVVVPATHAVVVLADVISDAVVDRVDCFRPLDCAKLSRAYQELARQQASLSNGFQAKPTERDFCDTVNVKTLAPPPERRTHVWRNDELRQFWELRCAPRYDGAAPIDTLAVLLLRAAGLDTTIANREAIMKRLSNLEVRNRGRLLPKELDRCSSEIRRCGGLRAWVNAVMSSGGAEAKPPPPPSVIAGKGLSSTWGSSINASTNPTSPTGANPTAASTWPASARTTGSSFTPRGRERKLFALRSDKLGPRTARGEGENSRLLDSVGQNLLKASQHIIIGEKGQVDLRHSTFGETPLHAAAVQDCRHAPIASLLLDRGADVHAEDRHLATPLHVAASTGNREVARKLLERGANAGKEDRWNSTPLHKAAAGGRTEMVQMLLSSGAAPHIADEWGATPLHRAVAHGQRAVAEQLLESGRADVDAEDHRGDRPLHLAASRGDYALVKVLLEHGGTASVRSRLAGKTPEDCARDRGHTDIVTLLHHRHEWISPRSHSVVLAS